MPKSSIHQEAEEFIRRVVTKGRNSGSSYNLAGIVTDAYEKSENELAATELLKKKGIKYFTGKQVVNMENFLPGDLLLDHPETYPTEAYVHGMLVGKDGKSLQGNNEKFQTVRDFQDYFREELLTMDEPILFRKSSRIKENVGEILTVRKISFHNDQGGTESTEGIFKVKVTKTWEDYETGQRYIGTLVRPIQFEQIKKLARTEFSPKKTVENVVYFGEFDL